MNRYRKIGIIKKENPDEELQSKLKLLSKLHESFRYLENNVNLISFRIDIFGSGRGRPKDVYNLIEALGEGMCVTANNMIFMIKNYGRDIPELQDVLKELRDIEYLSYSIESESYKHIWEIDRKIYEENQKEKYVEKISKILDGLIDMIKKNSELVTETLHYYNALQYKEEEVV